MVLERDPFKNPKAAQREPAAPRINWDAALAGIGDRHLRAAGDALWAAGKLDDGRWKKDAQIEFDMADGSVQAGVVVRATSDGMVHVLADESASRFIVPASKVRPISGALKRAKLAEEFRRTAVRQERFASTRSLTPADAEGFEYTATLQLDAGFKPSEQDVAEFVRHAYPGARVIDGDDRQPGRLHLRLRFATKEMAKRAFETTTGIDRQPTNEGISTSDDAYESMFVAPLSHNESDVKMQHHASEGDEVQIELLCGHISQADRHETGHTETWDHAAENAERAKNIVERFGGRLVQRETEDNSDVYLDSYVYVPREAVDDVLKEFDDAKIDYDHVDNKRVPLRLESDRQKTMVQRMSPADMGRADQAQEEIAREEAKRKQRRLRQREDDSYRTMAPSELPDWLEPSGHTAEDKAAVDSTASDYWKRYYDEYGDEMVKQLAERTASMFDDKLLHMQVVASLARGFEVRAVDESKQLVTPEAIANAVLSRPNTYAQYVDTVLAQYLRSNPNMMAKQKPEQLAAVIRSNPAIGEYLLNPKRLDSEGNVLAPSTRSGPAEALRPRLTETETPAYWNPWRVQKEQPAYGVDMSKPEQEAPAAPAAPATPATPATPAAPSQTTPNVPTPRKVRTPEPAPPSTPPNVPTPRTVRTPEATRVAQKMPDGNELFADTRSKAPTRPRAFGDIPFDVVNPRMEGAYSFVDVVFDAEAAAGHNLSNFVESAFRARASQLKVDWGWVSAVRVVALDPEAGIATLRYRSNQPATGIPTVGVR